MSEFTSDARELLLLFPPCFAMFFGNSSHSNFISVNRAWLALDSVIKVESSQSSIDPSTRLLKLPSGQLSIFSSFDFRFLHELCILCEDLYIGFLNFLLPPFAQDPLDTVSDHIAYIEQKHTNQGEDEGKS